MTLICTFIIIRSFKLLYWYQYLVFLRMETFTLILLRLTATLAYKHVHACSHTQQSASHQAHSHTHPGCPIFQRKLNFYLPVRWTSRAKYLYSGSLQSLQLKQIGSNVLPRSKTGLLALCPFIKDKRRKFLKIPLEYSKPFANPQERGQI